MSNDWENCKGCDGDFRHHHCAVCNRAQFGEASVYAGGRCYMCAISINSDAEQEAKN